MVDTCFIILCLACLIIIGLTYLSSVYFYMGQAVTYRDSEKDKFLQSYITDHLWKAIYLYELDGVGPVDNKSSTN